MKIGYVGTNHHHVDPYLASIDQLPAEVIAVADPERDMSDDDDDRFADAEGYESPAALFDGADVDLVWLTASNRQTPDLVRAAIDRDLHVFTEKPAARTAADLDPVAEAARRSESVVGTAYTWRAHPIAEQLQGFVADGFFGDLRNVDMRFFASDPASRPTNHYLFDPAASRGGIVQWLGVHWLDLLPWLLEEPIAAVNATLAEAEGLGVEVGASIQFETAAGTNGSHDCGYYLDEDRYDTSIALHGTEGYSSWDPMGDRFGFEGETALELCALGSQWESTPRRRIVHEYEPAPGYGGTWGLSFFEEFLEACREDGEPPADLDDALAVLRVLDAIYDSADRREWVAVGE